MAQAGTSKFEVRGNVLRTFDGISSRSIDNASELRIINCLLLDEADRIAH